MPFHWGGQPSGLTVEKLVRPSPFDLQQQSGCVSTNGMGLVWVVPWAVHDVVALDGVEGVGRPVAGDGDDWWWNVAAPVHVWLLVMCGVVACLE